MRDPAIKAPAAALWLTVVLAPAVPAAELDVYGGLGLGYAAQEVKQPGLLIGPGQFLSRDIEGSDLAARVFAGVRLHPYLAIEAGYVDLGKVDALVPVLTSDAQLGQVDTKIDTSGWEVTVVGIWPINREFEAFGKLGLVAWDSDFTEDGAGAASQDGTDLAYGLGIDYLGTERLRFRIEGMVYDLSGFDEAIAVTGSVIYSFPIGR
jgi:hypothetical protein